MKISKEILKYPFNGRMDENEKYLSETICEKASVIIGKTSQTLYIGKVKISGTTIIWMFVFGIVFGRVNNSEAMGFSSIPHRAPITYLNSYQNVRSTPIVEKRLDKIYFMPNKEIIPLIYLNAQQAHVNEKILKKLRGGDLFSNLVLIALSAVVYLMLLGAGVDGFAFLQQIASANAPTPSTPYGGHPTVNPTTKLASYRNGRAQFSPNFKCSFDRFIELTSENGETTPGTVRATISALQLEADGFVSNVRRDTVAEANGVKAFDYLADGPNGETHLEIKGPVGSEIRKAVGLGPSIPKQGKKICFKIRNQLNYWFNPNNIYRLELTQPENRDKVLVVNDMFDVSPPEKAQMKSAINYGIKGEHPVLFINNVINR